MDHDAIQSWASRVQTVRAPERVRFGLVLSFLHLPHLSKVTIYR